MMRATALMRKKPKYSRDIEVRARSRQVHQRLPKYDKVVAMVTEIARHVSGLCEIGESSQMNRK